MSIEIISSTLIAATATPPAGAYDLTTLAAVHSELSVQPIDTANDAFFSKNITAASLLISTECNRIFQVEAVRDVCYIEGDAYPYQLPGGVWPLQASRFPFVSTTVVPFTANADGTTAVLTNVSTFVGIAAGLLVFGAVPPGSPALPASSGPAFAGVPDGTVIRSFDAVAGTITLSNPTTIAQAGASFSTGVNAIETPTPGVNNTLVYGRDYKVDPKKGWFLRLNPFTGYAEKWPAVPVAIDYQAGYAAIPPDLELGCLLMVTDRYRSRGRDPRLRSLGQPGVGSPVWVGAMPGQDSGLPPEIALIVRNYRMPSSR